MNFRQRVLMRAFGRPQGLAGRFGGWIMVRTNGPVAARAVELLQLRPGNRVLDIGCGPGVGIQHLVRAGVVAVGVDPSPVMLEQARKRNAAAIAGRRAELRQGVAEALPCGDGTFDRVLAVNSFQLWSPSSEGLREVFRVLRPGGRLVLGFSRHSGQHRDEVPAHVFAAGFLNVQIADGESPGEFYVVAVRP